MSDILTNPHQSRTVKFVSSSSQRHNVKKCRDEKRHNGYMLSPGADAAGFIVLYTPEKEEGCTTHKNASTKMPSNILKKQNGILKILEFTLNALVSFVPHPV